MVLSFAARYDRRHNLVLDGRDRLLDVVLVFVLVHPPGEIAGDHQRFPVLWTTTGAGDGGAVAEKTDLVSDCWGEKEESPGQTRLWYTFSTTRRSPVCRCEGWRPSSGSSTPATFLPTPGSRNPDAKTCLATNGRAYATPAEDHQSRRVVVHHSRGTDHSTVLNCKGLRDRGDTSSPDVVFWQTGQDRRVRKGPGVRAGGVSGGRLLKDPERLSSGRRSTPSRQSRRGGRGTSTSSRRRSRSRQV